MFLLDKMRLVSLSFFPFSNWNPIMLTVCLFLLFTGSCHSTSILLGHDLCICPIRKLCCLWWLRQHLFHLQPENTWGQCTREPWTGRTYRYLIHSFFFFFLTDLLFRMDLTDFSTDVVAIKDWFLYLIEACWIQLCSVLCASTVVMTTKAV